MLDKKIINFTNMRGNNRNGLEAGDNNKNSRK